MRATVIFTSLVLIVTMMSGAMPVNGEVELYDKVVRLHVIANSDSDEDQTLKLKVRDAVLEDMREYMSSSATAEQAEQIIEANQDRVRRAAEKCIKENGYDDSVSVVLGYESYPTRVYEGVSLPSGSYYSVRIMIGEASGQNWWCVLFPPLCVGAASAEDELVEAGLTKEEVDILCDNDSEEYIIKFKILEFFKSVFKK